MRSLIGITAAVLMLTAGAVSSRAHETSSQLSNLGLATPFVEASACLSKCDLECPGEHEHRTYDADDANNLSSEPHPCEEGEANCEHTVCGSGGNLAADDLNELRLAFIEADAEKIKALINRFEAKIILNHKRTALQVLGCDAMVVAHFPLDADELAVLAD